MSSMTKSLSAVVTLVGFADDIAMVPKAKSEEFLAKRNRDLLKELSFYIWNLI